MQDKLHNPLSAEEMACLVDGRGTEDQVRQWRQRLLHNREQREEYAELIELTGEKHGLVEEYRVEELADRYFPTPALGDICIRVKDNLLRLVEAAGWSVPALDYRDDGTDAAEGDEGMMSLNRQVDNLDINLQIIRVKKDSLNLSVEIRDMVNQQAPDMKVSLVKNGRVLNSRHLENSQARFREIVPGEYDVSMAGPDGERFKVRLKID
ncbi:hypothetical protein ACFL5V_12785 [Fibrobacterota bacterium]